MKVGVAGLGRMGGAIAKRLIEVGHEVVVWNRNQDKTKVLVAAGAAVAATPSELAASVETIITILTDAGAIASVYEGKSGLLAGDVSGKLFIEMSTVQPETEIALAKKVTAKGATLVECPVGGTVGPALSGKLLGVAGGTLQDFARAKPLLEQMCRRFDLVGPVGAGASMKLAINLPLATFWQSFGKPSRCAATSISIRHGWLNCSPIRPEDPTCFAPAAAQLRWRCRTRIQARRPSIAIPSARICGPWSRKQSRAALRCRWLSARLRSTIRPAQRGGGLRIAPNCPPSGPAATVPEL